MKNSKLILYQNNKYKLKEFNYRISVLKVPNAPITTQGKIILTIQ